MKTKKCIAVVLSIVLLAISLHTIVVGIGPDAESSVISEKLAEYMEQTNDLIPVYIWYADIDHEATELAVTTKLGYAKEDIGMLAAERTGIAANKQEIAALQEELSSTGSEEALELYLELTREERKVEQELTSEYIKEKRCAEKNAYNKKQKQVYAALDLTDDSLVFSSDYAPMMIAELTKEEIETISENDSIVRIVLYEDVEAIECDATEQQNLLDLQDCIFIARIKDEIGVTGNGVSVGIVETYNVYPSAHTDELPSNRFYNVGITFDQPNSSNHANNTARIFCGNYGVASGATCYSCAVERGMYNSYNGPVNYFGAIELLINAGVTVINSSFCYSTYSSYDSIEEWIDHVVNIHNVTFVVSAGNDMNGTDGHRVLSPGRADNVITVGAFEHFYTTSTLDDTMYAYSCYDQNTNGTGGCEKPDVVAPADILGGGTSSSAPIISGIVALMLEARPSLALYPNILKAAILASCHYKANPATGQTTETMADGLTNVQGAGAPNAFIAVAIVSSGNYGIRTMSAGSTTSETKVRQPKYDAAGVNFSITWLRNNTVSGSNHVNGTVTVANRQDLNLTIKRANSPVKTSAKLHSSTEMAYVTLTTSCNEYTIKVTRSTNTGVPVTYAYAWSINTERYQHTEEFEGIYYLKNVKSGYYLTLDPSTNNNTQTAYSGGISQLWVLDKTTGLFYDLESANGTSGVINVGSVISGSYRFTTLSSTQKKKITVVYHSDGSCSFQRTISSVVNAIGVYNNSTSSGEYVAWAPYSASNTSQRWYLEKYAYLRGDVDMDGAVTAMDAYNVLQYALGSDTPNFIQTFLADLDGDGIITAADARIANRRAVGLE